MKNTTILVITGIFIVAVAGFIFVNSENVNLNNSGSSEVISNGDSQKITLGIKDYNYYPNTIEVESGKLVEITLDKSVGGCYRSFVMPDLGINELSNNINEKIIFTPTKTGSYTFRCGMGMGYGKLIVK